ncbi:MAG: histidine-type phosphatase, partial [Selenomonadaceae bacterium]|nr:histidine-type phosphatase [Selenomonadaceae bacterium]
MRKFNLLCFALFLIVQCLSVSIVSANLKEYYTLEKVVVYSRHNMRAPLNITPDLLLYKVTPHTWFTWSDKSGELTSKGGELETLMGQYFRKWLEAEKLIPENYVPQKDETRFYANSAQRTIATAKYFSAGFLPIANVEVERHLALNRMDSVFVFDSGTFPLTAEFQEQVQRDISKMGGTSKLGESVADGVALVEDILDFKNSIYAKENNLKTFHKKNEPDLIMGSDLLNQLIISNMALNNRNIPYLGIYSACASS